MADIVDPLLKVTLYGFYTYREMDKELYRSVSVYHCLKYCCRASLKLPQILIHVSPCYQLERLWSLDGRACVLYVH